MKELEALNPELRAQRTPPKESDVAQAVVGQNNPEKGWPLRVPKDKGQAVIASLAKIKRDEIALERYVVRFGETVDQVAVARGTTAGKLAEINGIEPGELVRGGTLLLVPVAVARTNTIERATSTSTSTTLADKPVAVVPADLFVYPGRKRVFYKVGVGDNVKELADAMHVTVDELRRWNDIDPSARLQEGMTLQAFVQDGADLSKIALLAENDVRVLTVGSEEFFAYFDKTKKRVVVTAKAGETVDAIGKRFGVAGSTMERINRRSRSDVLKDGENVVVYVSGTTASTSASTSTSRSTSTREPGPLGALPAAPRADLLPPTTL